VQIRRALPHLDLHDDVAAVVGVTRNQQAAQCLLGNVELFSERGNFGRKRRVLRSHLGRCRQVVGQRSPDVERCDNAPKLCIPAIDALGARRVGVQVWV